MGLAQHDDADEQPHQPGHITLEAPTADLRNRLVAADRPYALGTLILNTVVGFRFIGLLQYIVVLPPSGLVP